MAGLIKTQLDKLSPLESIAGYDPEKSIVAPEETVAGQLKTVIGADSPLIQGARTRAAQEANRRGLLNSSMALQAGEEAVHSAALPIASADAATFSNRALANQAVGNRASEFTAGAGNVAALQERAGQQAFEQQELRGEQETGLQTLRGTQDIAVQQLRGTQATALANIEAQYKNLTQSSASATALFSQVSKNIAYILNDPNTSVEQKQS